MEEALHKTVNSPFNQPKSIYDIARARAASLNYNKKQI
jgi:hypothetical protein